MMRRSLAILLVVLVGTTGYLSCGGDESPAPPVVQKDCSLSTGTLDFGDICLGDSSSLSFSIAAPASNTESVSGSVSEACGHFSIVSGGGNYTLQPGDTRVVMVKLKPTTVGSFNCTIATGSNCSDVVCTTVVADCKACEVVPTSLNFGQVCVGQSSDKTFTITSPSTNQMNVTGNVTETCADYSIVSGGGAFTLTPGQSRVVTVRFEPTTAGSKVCTIATGPNCDDVAGSGTGTVGTCVVSPTTLDFRTVCVGTSADKTFTITCPPKSPCPISGTITENCADYSIISGGGAYTLNPGQSRTVRVRFSPKSGGTKACTISTGSNCADVESTGDGGLATCTVTPTSLSFGSVCVGSSADKKFTISNPPTSPCPITGRVQETCPHYAIVIGGGAYTLDPGQSLVVTVRFRPTSTGAKTCTILTGPDCPDISATGTGAVGTCTVGPTSLNFGSVCVGSSTDKSFVITCPSSSPCPVSGNVTETCAHYSIVSGGGAFTLNPGQSRTVVVRFSPTSTGSKTCTIATGADCPDIPCSGTGVQATCTVSPASLSFTTICPLGGWQDKNFTITCPLSSPCALSGSVSETSAHYSIISGAGAYTLQPGQSRTVTVRFQPTSTGTKTVTIQTGSLCGNVSATGLGQDWAYLDIKGTSVTGFKWRSNWYTTTPILSLKRMLYGNPFWNGCNESAWQMDGDQLQQSFVGLFGLSVPPGTISLEVEFRGDASNKCVEQFLMVDGIGLFWTNLSTSCTGYKRTWPLSAGIHNIVLGLQATGLSACSDDMMFNSRFADGSKWIRFTFVGSCTTMLQEASGEGTATVVKTDIDFEVRE